MTLTMELQAAVSATRTLFGAAACSCALASDDGAELRFIAAAGVGAAEIVGITLPVSRGIAGWVALSGQPIAVGDVTRDERFARDVAEATAYVPTAILAAPLLDDEGETVGVIEVLDPSRPDDESRLGSQRGTAAELASLTVIAAQIATIVRLSGLVDTATALPPDLVTSLSELAALDPAAALLAREVVGALAAYARRS